MSQSAPKHIDRPPRLQPEIPFGEVPIPKPPESSPEDRGRLLQIGLPLISIVGYVLVASFGGGRSLGMLIPMALSVVASMTFSVYSFLKERGQRAAALQAYQERLVELSREMKQAHDQQRRFYSYNYPEPQTNLHIVAQTKDLTTQTGQRPLRSESRLWERRTSDDDFAMIRLGIGSRPSSVIYTLQEIEHFNDPLARAAMKLATDSQVVHQVPITLSLRPPIKDLTADDETLNADEQEQRPPTPATHALALAGTPESVYACVWALLAQMVVFHTSSDTRLYILATDRQPWSWAQKLPHTQEGEDTNFIFFVDQHQPTTPDQHDDEGDEFDRYMESLRRLLVQRKIRLQQKDAAEDQGDPRLPFCLVVVDLLAATLPERLNAIETEAAIAILLAEGANLGATILFLVPERVKAPSGCQALIEIEETTLVTNTKRPNERQLTFRYAETGVNSFRYLGVADHVADVETMRQLAEDLRLLMVRQSAGAYVPPAVSYMDLVGYGSIDDLRDDAWKRWREANEAKRANWLRVSLGRMAGNKRRTLVFSAKRDGVHGMVAGSTGSGKSELLIALIAGLAVNYDPETLNFVLVDYKGGGAFKEFANLPHCVDIITNLAADGVTRMFTAIRAEMNRRQELNTSTDTKDIVEYRKKGLHLTHKPYPFLFIVIDEFAEMIADRAEYKSQLETITRLGRAQGVSLILAAQNPSGVTDQMRSNIKFRICLRVESGQESREMLRRQDAAFLPTGMPGRGYLQVGNDEIELIQIAYTGEPYRDPNRSRPLVKWPDRHPNDDAGQDTVAPELYKLIIATLNQLADKQKRPKQLAPWPKSLPDHLALSDWLISDDPRIKTLTAEQYLSHEAVQHVTLAQPREANLSLNPALTHWLEGMPGWVEVEHADAATRKTFWNSYALRPVVGLIDNPYAACNMPLVVDLVRGHTIIYGASGWGKSTFLRTLAISLAASHSPNYLHLYLLDLGGRGFGVLRKLPHVGAVITPDEEAYEERVNQLVREIEQLIDARKKVLGSDDLIAYNQRNAVQPLPAIVLLIDNFSEFVATFGDTSDNVESLLQRFIVVLRQAKTYGVHVVISAAQPADVPSGVTSLFTERMTLRLADSTEYRTIVGGAVEEIGSVAGRGYVRIAGQPLAFQVALPITSTQNSDQSNEQRELERLAEAMQSHIADHPARYIRPPRVDGLPRSVLLKEILSDKWLRNTKLTFAELTVSTRQAWVKSRDPHHADWLQAVIGLSSGNRPRQIHFEASKDGVHGLIAGGTGSGKSELLMSLVVSLALRYAPDTLNFVLVDYKGGGAFKPFENLPHVVDMVTNLNRAAVKRVFTAIRAEMERRQALNKETGTENIIAYRRKGLHLTGVPYPHLFIIIDEYAEMIRDNAEFAEELESITRLGRAQGVYLLLASQRPIGVTDQMRANIKLRICLRVEQAETSRELLRRPDAAALPNGLPGRGYLQAGNEGVELLQFAYTGETFESAPPTAEGEKLRFYQAVVQMAQGLLGSAPRPSAPWPAPLSTFTFADVVPLDRVDPHFLALMTNDPTRVPLVLSAAVHDWYQGHGRWAGVDWSQTALRGVVGLVDNPYAARLLPLIVDLSRGHAVVFGASGWGKSSFLRALALHLSATHSPAELHLHMLDLGGGRSLEMLNPLPHVGTYISPDATGYEERLQQLWRQLQELIADRQALFSNQKVSSIEEYNRKCAGQPLPAQVILIDNVGELIETFGVTRSEKRDMADNPLESFVTLARQGRAFGLYMVISANRPQQISSKLYSLFTERFTLRLGDSSDYSMVVGVGAGEVEEINGRGLVRIEGRPLTFQVALVPGSLDAQGKVCDESDQVRQIAQHMQDLIAQTGLSYPQPIRIDALASKLAYRDMLARSCKISPLYAHFLAQLPAAMQQQWQTNAEPDAADWLKVPLGTGSGNRDRILTLEAKKDGVHALIAGGTGSGKSEVLMTFITGLAVHYSPEVLNFVLVDYKGGGAFKPFEHLPHVVDMVTNLDKSAVHRMFTAIDAEMQRRQRLNAETGTKDIVEYRNKGYHRSREAYPHLCVIIDEFSEMISDNPDYRIQLDSITRVGRAQGVNLILASQRPKGVSDQMRANIKLRLCLRVEELDTSRDMLRRPDAAFLPNNLPGRGYIQVGNENLELIQVAYSGEEVPGAHFVNLDANQARQDETPRLFDAVVSLAHELNAGRLVPRPWPGFLPAAFSLDTPLSDGKSTQRYLLEPAMANWLVQDTPRLWPGIVWNAPDAPLPQNKSRAMQPIVGLMDLPSEATQRPMQLDLSRNHVAIFGDAGTGRSTFLRTLLLSLATTHTPDELHAYILDLGGRGLRSLEALPHAGAVIYSDENHFEERLQRLLDTLDRIVQTRQQRISEAGVDHLYAYNALHAGEPLPAILVVIDNIAELQEGYEKLIEDALIPLVRRSLNAGISFVISANLPANMPPRLYNLFTERITLRQSNLDRYMDLVGRGVVEFENQPGRGYIRRGQRPVLFQTALPLGVTALNTPSGSDQMQAHLVQLTTHMRDLIVQRGWRTKPEPIPVLPELLPLDELLTQLPAPGSGQIEVALGLNRHLEPVSLDLKRIAPHMAIVGPPLSGRTTALTTWALALASRHSPDQVRIVLVDMQRKFMNYGGQQSLADLPHVVATITEKEQLADLVDRITDEAKRMAAGEIGHQLFVLIDNFEEFSQDLHTAQQQALASLARRHGADGLHFIIATAPETSSMSDLRRQIMAAHLGIGLRASQSLDVLRVTRIPAGFKDRELPPGRGYLVRSGVPQLIHLASATAVPATEAELSEDALANAVVTRLDQWVERIQASYPEPVAAWSDSRIQAVASQQVEDPHIQRQWTLLQQGAQRELQALRSDTRKLDLNTPLLVEELLQLNGQRSPERLRQLLHELYRRESRAQGMDDSLIDSMLETFKDEDIIREVARMVESSQP
ncbi:FtsK/SpoIIIE domain-containing protein [Candidatus Oscillochloris fontis]|uniref:FtsK/SpoIIIE domain-containing protein n=1 Tax=Candidatus Oscillochloris fontis TaxID=2496868 RepID=UPI00101C20AE|nr:FtsK/SpoIIIE domain-containing protein [Candidatus Oscillochloris fontis]